MYFASVAAGLSYSAWQVSLTGDSVPLSLHECQHTITGCINLLHSRLIHYHEGALVSCLEHHRFGVLSAIPHFVHFHVPSIHFALTLLDLPGQLVLFDFTVLVFLKCLNTSSVEICLEQVHINDWFLDDILQCRCLLYLLGFAISLTYRDERVSLK